MKKKYHPSGDSSGFLRRLRKTIEEQAKESQQEAAGNFTALQVRRAYRLHFGAPMPDNLSFVDAGRKLVEALGADAARELIAAQSNDPRRTVNDE